MIVGTNEKLFRIKIYSNNKFNWTMRVGRFVGLVLGPKQIILEGWAACNTSTRGHARDPSSTPLGEESLRRRRMNYELLLGATTDLGGGLGGPQSTLRFG